MGRDRRNVISHRTSAAGSSESCGASVSQTQLNCLEITARVPDGTDRVRIEAKMTYLGTEYVNVTAEVVSDGGEARLAVPYFGRYEVRTTCFKDGKCAARQDDIVGVAAREYNIAPLIATIPVLIFSLKYLSSDPDIPGDGGEIPTIVVLARDRQYDWDALPRGMFRLPYITEEDRRGDFALLNEQLPKIVKYLDELRDIYPDSHFNFFVNDRHSGSVLPELIYLRRMKRGTYSLRLITDGSGSSEHLLGATYGGQPDAMAVHKRRSLRLRLILLVLRTFGKIRSTWGAHFAYYSYIFCGVEDDAGWWILSKRAEDDFGIIDRRFLEQFLADERVREHNINEMISSVRAAGRMDELKALYKFDDGLFEGDETDGRRIMMILGTGSKIGRNHPVREYIRLTQAYYGDSYRYIYKGHPGYVPNEEEREELESLGVRVVDPSIAAELFTFFHPDLMISGYPSTTFLSTAEENIGAMFLLCKKRAFESTERVWLPVKHYAENVEFFASEINDPEWINKDEPVRALSDDTDRDCYLLEFRDGHRFSAGLWDPEEGVLKLYTKDPQGGYTLAETRSLSRD